MRSKKKQFAVLGLGSFGSSLAESLCAMGHEVLGVDTDGELVQEFSTVLTQAVQADATDEDVLESLGIRNFDAAIVSIGTNIRDSVLIAVLCKEMGVPYIVAKAVDDLHAKVLRKVGVDRVVFPEREMGVRVAKSLVAPNILELVELPDGYEIAEVAAPPTWCGRTLMDVNVRRDHGLSVIGIRRDSGFIASPGAQEGIRTGDVLVVLGKQQDIDRID